MTTPSLSRSGVDRAAEHRDDPEWLAQAWESGHLLILDDQGRALVDDEADPQLRLIDAGSWEGQDERYFLGVGPDGTAYWAVSAPVSPRLGLRPMGLREVGAALDDAHSGLLVTAMALSQWHATHPRCPQCGAPTVVEQAGWSRRCTSDGSQHFPRTDPAVIVLLHDGGDRALLGRQPTWPPGRYSTIAGFVEAGESAEQCVVREVREETGVEITDVTYCGSQPWPFPRSLMLGYRALVVGGHAEAADRELEDVRWFTRGELFDDGRRGGGPLLPPPSSIAHWLITTWRDEPSPG